MQMDKAFYDKIRKYRAERGQSPYVNTMSGTTSVLSALKSRAGGSGGVTGTATTSGTTPLPTDTSRADFYGEKIRSVQDYRHWLRRQQKWNREHLGPDAQPIRGL